MKTQIVIFLEILRNYQLLRHAARGIYTEQSINLEEKWDSLGVTRNELYYTANLKCVMLEIS